MKTPAQILTDKLSVSFDRLALAESRAKAISEKVKGWSVPSHYLFFQLALETLPGISRILVLGVYHGRDMSFIVDGCNRTLEITGVDKFADEPCDDWPTENRAKKWNEAGYGDAPSFQAANDNVLAHKAPQHTVNFLASDDESALKLLAEQGKKFELIYLDTAHDRATVERQLEQIRPLCTLETLIAGDDYENILPTWGVKDAVAARFLEHHILGDSIWFADVQSLKSSAP